MSIESIERNESREEILVNELSHLLHEAWRKTRLDEATGQYTPRVKVTSDQVWIEQHGGIKEVDIANTEFADLPEDWKQENIIASKIALEKLTDVLYIIHERWLDRNVAHATDEQVLNYSRLPKSEKEKDLNILKEAIEVLEKHLS